MKISIFDTFGYNTLFFFFKFFNFFSFKNLIRTIEMEYPVAGRFVDMEDINISKYPVI